MSALAIERMVPACELPGECRLWSRQQSVRHRIDVAATTAQAKGSILLAAFEQVVHTLCGERPTNPVNPEVWDRLAPAAS